MEGKGVHHLGLATLDIDRTMDFYTSILGWKVAWCDILEPPGGGRIRHAFMDTGDGTLVAFMCPEKVQGIPQEFKTDITAHRICPPPFITSRSIAIRSKSSKKNAKSCSSTASTSLRW